MQEAVLSQGTNDLDLSKIAALQQKRTLAFVNHFVITTAQFLNHFLKTCERKLMHFERKLEKVNAAMVLLETRLSSIPEVNTTLETTTEIATEPKEAVTESKSAEEDKPNLCQENNTVNLEEKQNIDSNSDNNDIKMKHEYERFVKMVHVGVPLDAVKLKLSLEGLDSNVLDKLLSK